MKLSDLRKRLADTGSAQVAREPAQPSASEPSPARLPEQPQLPVFTCDRCGAQMLVTGEGPVKVLKCPACGVCNECKKAATVEGYELCADCLKARREKARQWFQEKMLSRVASGDVDVAIVSTRMHADDLGRAFKARDDMTRFPCAACFAPASVYNPHARCVQCQHDEEEASARAKAFPYACARCGKSHAVTWRGGTCPDGCTYPSKRKRERAR